LLDALIELIPSGDKRWLKVLDAMPVQPEWVVDHRADSGVASGIRVMRQVAQLLEQSSDRLRLAAVKFNLGSLLAWGTGEIEEAQVLLEEARDLFADAGDDRGRLLAANELGYIFGLAGDGAGHEAAARAVLAEGRASGDGLVQLQALCALAWATQVRGELRSVQPYVDEALAIARAEDKAYRVCYLIGQQGYLAAHLGDMVEARRQLAAAQAAHPAARDTILLDFTAIVLHIAGELGDVLPAFREAVAWTGGVSRRRALVATATAVALAEQGRFEEASEVATLANDAFDGRHWWAHATLAEWSAGVLVWLRGDAKAGVRMLADASEYQARMSYVGWGRETLADLAEAAVDAGEPSLAEAAAKRAAADPARAEAPNLEALAHMTEGCARLSSGDASAAVPLFEAAVEEFGASGWGLYQARCRALAALALAGDDRPRAIETMRAAAEQFAAFGATVRHERALRALEGMGPGGRRTKTAVSGPGSLTRREREVARLAAEGRSAKEIAQELFIGERTVETHLANAYAKLGVSSKVELVRMAPELGL